MPLLILVTAKTQKISIAKSLKVTVWKVTKSCCQEQNLIILHEILGARITSNHLAAPREFHADLLARAGVAVTQEKEESSGKEDQPGTSLKLEKTDESAVKKEDGVTVIEEEAGVTVLLEKDEVAVKLEVVEESLKKEKNDMSNVTMTDALSVTDDENVVSEPKKEAEVPLSKE